MSNIIEFTKQRIDNNNQLQTFVQQARTVANVIFPETLPFSDKYNKLGAEIVTVDAKNSNHVYKNESGGFCLHLSKLNEIAKAAKIRVIGSKILERKTDETGRVTFISHQVTVQYRTISGEMISESYTGKYDYFNDLATKSDGQTKSRRKHAEALAESNALYRAFNKVLPQLPQSFKEHEFSKPFLIPYVEEDKNAMLAEFTEEEQKQLKKELYRKRMGLVDEQMYPQNNVAPALPESKNENISDANFTDLPQEQNGPSKAEQNKIIADEFRNVPQTERTTKIMNLIKLKGWKHPKGAIVTSTMIEKATIDDQINRIEEMLNMPDEVEEEVGL